MKRQKSLFGSEEKYSPEEPYIFNTGKYKGRSAEVLMFRDYGHLIFILQKIKENWKGGKKNRLHKHLEWLLGKGDKILSKIRLTCPYCDKDHPATHYSVLRNYYSNSFSIGTQYICCDSKNCKEKIRYQAFGKNPNFYSFKFSNIKRVSYYKSEEERVGRLYQAAYGLGSKRISTKKAFNLFKQQEQS